MSFKVLEILRVFFFNSISIFIFIFLKLKFRKKYPHPQNKILFINSGFLGDNILASLILVNDKLFDQENNAYMLLDAKYRILFADYSGSVKLIYYDLDNYRYELKYRVRLLKKIINEGFEEVYNINFVRHTIDDELTVIGTCGRSYAFENNNKLMRFFEGLYTKHFSKLISVTSGNNFNELSELIKSITSKDIVSRTKLYFNQDYNKLILNLTKEEFVIIAPFCSKSIKEYPLENYLELINYIISNYDLSVIVVGDREVSFPSIVNKKFINLTGHTNLLEVLHLINNCRVFVGNDSGLLHAAIALEKKSIGIVGGGVWGKIYPYGDYTNVDYMHKYLECFSCDWHCVYKEPKCLYEIDKNKLIGIIDKKLKNE